MVVNGCRWSLRVPDVRAATLPGFVAFVRDAGGGGAFGSIVFFSVPEWAQISGVVREAAVPHFAAFVRDSPDSSAAFLAAPEWVQRRPEVQEVRDQMMGD